MKIFKVLEPIKNNDKYLLPDDKLILISEFHGGSNGNSCVLPHKTFCDSITREEVVIYMNDFSKIEDLL